MARQPSVTEILGAYGLFDGMNGIDPQVMQTALDRGVLVGKAANYMALGQVVPWKEPHPELAPFVDGYELFLREHAFTLQTWEQELVAVAFGYLTHPDQIGVLDNCRAIVEIKTGTYRPIPTRLQTAAQQLAAECQNINGLLRYCLHLPGDGSYHLIPHREERDKAEFIALAQTAHLAMKYDLPLGRKLMQIMEERDRD